MKNKSPPILRGLSRPLALRHEPPLFVALLPFHAAQPGRYWVLGIASSCPDSPFWLFFSFFSPNPRLIHHNSSNSSGRTARGKYPSLSGVWRKNERAKRKKKKKKNEQKYPSPPPLHSISTSEPWPSTNSRGKSLDSPSPSSPPALFSGPDPARVPRVQTRCLSGVALVWTSSGW